MPRHKHIVPALALIVIALSGQVMPATEKGDVGRGRAAYHDCATCHGDRGQGTDIAPDLRGIVGRDVAADTAYAYSGAMRRYGGTWTEDRLAAFLTQPQATVRGNRMPYGGTASDKQARDIVAYLDTLE